MERSLLLNKSDVRIKDTVLDAQLDRANFRVGEESALGIVQFSLIKVLQWATVSLQSANDDLQIRLWNGSDLGDDGYAVAEASVADPLNVTGKPARFFDRPMTASFVAVSSICRGERFNCDLYQVSTKLGRLHLGTIGRIAVTREI